MFRRPKLEGRVARRTQRPGLRARSRRRGRHRFRVAQIRRNVCRCRWEVRAAKEVHDVTRAWRRGRSLFTRTTPLGGRAARPPRRRHDGHPHLGCGRLYRIRRKAREKQQAPNQHEFHVFVRLSRTRRNVSSRLIARREACRAAAVERRVPLDGRVLPLRRMPRVFGGPQPPGGHVQQRASAV